MWVCVLLPPLPHPRLQLFRSFLPVCVLSRYLYALSRNRHSKHKYFEGKEDTITAIVRFGLFSMIEQEKTPSCVNLDSGFLAVNCFVVSDDSSICS